MRKKLTFILAASGWIAGLAVYAYRAYAAPVAAVGHVFVLKHSSLLHVVVANKGGVSELRYGMSDRRTYTATWAKGEDCMLTDGHLVVHSADERGYAVEYLAHRISKVGFRLCPDRVMFDVTEAGLRRIIDRGDGYQVTMREGETER